MEFNEFKVGQKVNCPYPTLHPNGHTVTKVNGDEVIFDDGSGVHRQLTTVINQFSIKVTTQKERLKAFLKDIEKQERKYEDEYGLFAVESKMLRLARDAATALYIALPDEDEDYVSGYSKGYQDGLTNGRAAQ